MPVEREYVDSIYFVGDGETMDYLARLYRRDGEPWTISYRFRYYKSFKSKDEKRWYEAKGEDDSPKTLSLARQALAHTLDALMNLWGSGANKDVIELQCYSDNPKMIFEIGSRPYVSMKQERIER